jgi:hypothetical protein
MKKFILFIICTVIVISAVSKADADTIVLPNETITGKITYVLSNLIEMQTPDGQKSITRNDSDGTYKDIVITGISKKKKITGNIFYLDGNSLEISTPSGNLKINRCNVKDIILFI